MHSDPNFCIGAYNRTLLLALFAARRQGNNDVQRSIAECVVAIQKGDQSAVPELVRRLQGPMLRQATSILKDPVTAEDVTLVALEKVLRHIPNIDDPQYFPRYARRAVRHAAIDLMRARHHRDSRRALQDTHAAEAATPDIATPLTERIADPRSDPEAAAQHHEDARALWRHVDGLGDPRATIVRRFYEDGRTYDEIAAEIGVSPATIKRHLGAARLQLAQRIQGARDDS
jgi:RNA polymerase sigma factor (sigma-70 family)